MRNTASCSNEYEEPQGQPPSVIDERKLKRGAPSEPLEIKIANRAYQISRRGGGNGGQSLARWLEAAREILSEDSERPC
jgi:hypothetical protein